MTGEFVPEFNPILENNLNHNRLNLEFRRAEDNDVRAFLRWRYEPPYDIYNLYSGDEIDKEKFEKEVRYFLDPCHACHSIFNQDGVLVGYCTFGKDGQVPGGDYSADALDIGLGVHPDWTGQGHGTTFARAVLDFANRGFSPVAFRVTVAEFNKRALRVWSKLGFQPVQTFIFAPENRPFVILMRGARV
jgi:RimJ/RimL family protein N-acetyltransferase